LPRLTSVSFRELVAGLRQFGFQGPWPGGKHFFMVKGSVRLTLPNPHREDIGVDLLKRLLRQAGIAPRDWLGR
jgi:predicted RNA binding protein YcfA (HicA-like mRNA interferase family)